MTSITDNGASLALPSVEKADWLIRLPIAATFIYHGLDKFPSLQAGAEFMGMPLALWTLVAVVEVVAGLAIVAGGFLNTRAGDIVTRIGGVSVVAIMIGAIGLVHWGQWSNIPSESHPAGGMEFQTLLLGAGLFFALRGNRA